MGRPKAELVLTTEEKAELQRLARRRNVGVVVAERARIILECGKGLENIQVAERLGITNQTVGKWRKRFIDSRLDGLSDDFRSGRPRSVSDRDVEKIVDTTLHKDPKAATHWSSRMLAEQLGVSPTAVQRVWRAFGLQPHRTESFSLSKDPYFVEKVRDVVGLYMSPPDNALVLCVDEKSQMQALERSQPLLPMQPTHPDRRTATYSRNGTTSLFAALDIATGRVIGKTFRRHRASEFIRFLGEIDSAVPADLELHLVLDNYATHKTPEVKRWLLRHPRFHMHFTPTSSSWLNLVESFFSIVERRVTKRGNHQSVTALEKDIRVFLDDHNSDPRPFVWKKTADQILDSLKRYTAKVGALRAEKAKRGSKAK
ncbi:Chromosome-anchoring protein RacA [Planctomycetes bacterium Poly30]|uniref:Chromosome-anchoring protein RacA n=1 Tax=Saltatorellus ferox TaxID=2528018 RepID=A0A518F0I4_9BACT|nr:Chromosome-anchoring protein RacA [Planctomycetes bacterium Poly30]